MPHRFAVGDKLRHTSKPEWGTGSVTAAQPQTHEGKAVQRLTIRFERGGLKTLSTAFAKLVPATQAAPAPYVNEAGEPVPVQSRDPGEVPEEVPDASRPALNRLQAALAPYRWDGSWPGLLDWAATMTGLADPLAKHTRTDLEAAFQRQRVSLVRELRAIHAAMTPIERELSGKLVQSASEDARRAWRTATERR